MNKIKRLVFILSLIFAAGMTWTIITLKNMPEAFNWEDDDEDN